MLNRMILLLFAFLLLTGCNEMPEPTATAVPSTAVPPTAHPPANPTPEPRPVLDSGIVISEVLLGMPGDNNREFIELYNAGTEAFSLNGWTLAYRLSADADEELIYTWAGADVPPLGHYLLVREGQTFDLNGDASFTVPLSPRKGGLVLRDGLGNEIDVLGWGDAPDGFFAGTAVTPPEDGSSLERLPGGEAGNGQSSGDNSLDWVSNGSPAPQNSGSPLTPPPAEELLIYLAAPELVEPGAEFTYEVTVGNASDTAVTQINVIIPLADNNFELVKLPPGAVETDAAIQWTIGEIPASGSVSALMTLRSPYTYIDTWVRGYYAETDGRLRAYGPPQIVRMAGGSVPIAAARTLPGSTVTVEGTATMYTGGLYAGSTSTKFYLEDETGGVQVYVPGAINDVQVNVGDRLRVTGEITVYRDSIELIPNDFTSDIEILAEGGDLWPSTPIAIADYTADDPIIGRLTTIEGTATRIEEFTYSYEMDISDEQGITTLLYIDKLTEMTIEPFDVDRQYRVTGISEFYSGQYQMYPRVQSDIVEIFPPELMLDVAAPNSIGLGEMMTVTLTAVNHTPSPLTNLQIRTNPPTGAALDEILDGGILESGTIFWNIAELAAGEKFAVNYRVVTGADSVGQVEIASASAAADEWPEPATTVPYLTFIGDGVPIWAIQGDGAASPYVRSEATTVGVVTAVFPELGGFWLQTLEPDGNPATSDGLFVLLEGLAAEVEADDLLQVTGRVREISGQTTLHPPTADSIVKLGTDYGGAVELTPYDPPQDVAEALVYNESLEGMLVAVQETAVAIAPTTKYGEYVLVAEKWGVETVRRTDEVGYLIYVDDGSSVTHLDDSSLPYTMRRGDTVDFLAGPLAYTFDNYKIEPIATSGFVVAERPLPILPEAGLNQFSISTFNTENFFDNRDPHPSDPPRPTKAGYQLKLDKVTEAIIAMGAPTIVGLQEVENIGVLETLVAQEKLAAYNYQPYLIEGEDSRGIDVAYIVRGDRATVESVEAFPAPDGLTSRPPLVIKVTIHLDSGDQTVYVLNNHFSSLSSGEAATEPRRTAQAAWNVTVMDQIRADDPAAQFVVLGDLNSFYQTLPINTLQESGLRHVYEWFGDEPLPYTYIFQGRTQTLDHILVSEELYDHMTLVQTLPIDADYPIPGADDNTALRVSDHDPLLAILTFE